MSVYCLPDFALTTVPRATLPAWIVGEGRLKRRSKALHYHGKKKEKNWATLTILFWSKRRHVNYSTLFTSHLTLRPNLAPCCMLYEAARETTGHKSDPGMDLVRPITRIHKFLLVKPILASYADVLWVCHAMFLVGGGGLCDELKESLRRRLNPFLRDHAVYIPNMCSAYMVLSRAFNCTLLSNTVPFLFAPSL